jgi:hypothetical protein
VSGRPIALARFVPSLAGLAALALVAALWLAGAHTTYDDLLTLWGMVPFREPFLDIDGPLSALDCARQGMDVILANPCDILQRPYNYSPFWLSFVWVPLGGDDRVAVGLVVDIALLISLSALPAPQSRSEMLLRVVASVSTMVVFALERANTDVFVFVLIVLMLDLLRRSPLARAAGYAVAFLAGAIKYYPLILFGLVAKERLLLCVSIALGLIVGLALFFEIYAEEIARTIVLVPHNTAFTDMFGAVNILLGTFDTALRQGVAQIDAVKLALAVTVPFAVPLLWVMVRFWRRSDIPAALCRLDDARRLALLAGALLVCGCFLTGQNIGYRGIFLLLIQPGLAALGRDRAAGPIAAAARLAAIAVPVLMWAEGMRLWLHLAVAGTYPSPGFLHLHWLDLPADLAAWAGREIVWWLLVAFLVSLLLGFFLDRLGALFQELGLAVRPKPAPGL